MDYWQNSQPLVIGDRRVVSVRDISGVAPDGLET
jgi:hypothetical protein